MTATLRGVFRTVLVVAVLAAARSAPAQQRNAEAFTIAPAGYVQIDLRAFPDWDITPGVGRASRPSIEVRRIRAGVEGSWRRMTFELSVDPQDDDGVFVKDAYGQVRFTRGLRLRVGHFKVPGTRDYDVSARRIDFIERTPLASSLAVGRDVGARLDGRLARRLTYEAGVFAGDGTGRDDRAHLTAAGRLLWQAAPDLEVGGSISDARTRAVDSDPANGPNVRSAAGYRFADGVYVQGQRLRLGADAEWSPGPWRIVGELLRTRDQRRAQGLDREDLPAAVGTGFSASVRRRLTRPLESMARYDFIGFDDVGGAATTDSVRPRATNIRPRANHALTVGSTWTVNAWMRLLGNVGVESYSEGRSAPVAGRKGPYVTAAARLQLELP